jgi:hypothetical protein
MRKYIGAKRVNNILSLLCLFVETMPINNVVASGNGNRILTQKLQVQMQIIIDRQNGRQKLNYCLLPNTLLFVIIYL